MLYYVCGKLDSCRKPFPDMVIRTGLNSAMKEANRIKKQGGYAYVEDENGIEVYSV